MSSLYNVSEALTHANLELSDKCCDVCGTNTDTLVSFPFPLSRNENVMCLTCLDARIEKYVKIPLFALHARVTPVLRRECIDRYGNCVDECNCWDPVKGN